MAGAVTPSLLRRMCSWSICRCNRVGAAGLTKIKKHIFELLVPQQSTHAEKSLHVPLL